MKSENEFVLLAQFTPRGVFLNQDGLKIIEYYDNLTIVTIEGSLGCKSMSNSLIDSKTRTQIRTSDHGVWISKYPKFYHRSTKYIALLRIVGDEEEMFTTAHSFCALVSSATILVWSDELDFRFLSSIKEKTKNLDSASEKIGALCVFPKRNSGDSQKFEDMLQKKNLGMRNFEYLYPKVFQYNDISKTQIDAALESGGDILNNLFKIYPLMEQQVFLDKKYGNQELILGPIIKSFIQNLVQGYSTYHQFDITKAEEDIEIEQDFQNYLLYIQKFNAKCKSKLNNQRAQNVKQLLLETRRETQNEQFFQNNPYYAQKMSIYMDRKEEELSKLNEEILDDHNLDFLQHLSNQTMKRVKSNGRITSTEIVEELNTLILTYKRQAARTPNKDKLLTQFLQIFTPALYNQTDIQSKLDHQIVQYDKTNSNLKEQIEKLKRKNKGKGNEPKNSKELKNSKETKDGKELKNSKEAKDGQKTKKGTKKDECCAIM